MCGKNHCQFVFLRSGKNQTCVAFIKHIPNTNVCGKSHTCLLKDKHVCHFPYKRWYFLYLQLYFVFFKSNLLHNIPLLHFRCDHAMSEVRNIFKSALEKITCLGIPTHVWKKPHRLKTKTAKTTPKQINFVCGHPLD